MTDRIVLRKVYALDSNTGLFLSSGQTLITDGLGGTNWTNMISSLGVYGGPAVGNLPSTLSSFSTLVYLNNTYFFGLSSLSTETNAQISTLSSIVAFQNPGQITAANLRSTVEGLGSVLYVSTSFLQDALVSTTKGVTSTGNVSSMSTIDNLGTLGYVSTLSLFSTVRGLASIGYISTSQLVSTVEGLNNYGPYLTTNAMVSTVVGLGSVGYISTSGLTSTVTGLGSLRYLSTTQLQSTVEGLGSTRYISSTGLQSTVAGLGSAGSAALGQGFISTASLISTTFALSTLKANIRFDNVTNITTIDSVNTFTNVTNVIYTSTFFTSSIYYAGNNNQAITAFNVPGTQDLLFSTAQISFAPFSNFINSNSRITIDLYPTIIFSKLATGATALAVLPISTLLMCNVAVPFPTTTVQNHVFVNNTRVTLESGNIIDNSNSFKTPIKMTIPPGIVSSNFTVPYNILHYMPSSLNNGAFQNALHNQTVVPYFGSTGSIFISVQNLA
jgi:hypothetical protein